MSVEKVPHPSIVEISEEAWKYKVRRLTFKKAASPLDTNAYSTSSTDYVKVATEKVNFGLANAIIHIVRARFVRDSRTNNAAYGAHSRIKIAGNPYCEGSTHSTDYVTLDNESIVDLFVKADANGKIAVDVELSIENASYKAYIKNITVEIWGMVIEPE